MKYQKKLIWSAVAATVFATGSLAQAASMEDRVKNLEEQMNATTHAMESRGGGGAGNTHLGGYGEMHYNSIHTDTPAGTATKREIDFHRFVLFFGHDFTDRIRMYSELELEHSFFENGGGNGEIELEQAYVEIDLNDSNRVKTGLFLLPVGIMNETHEPDSFYGVERNPVENAIIPTTWWEGGVGLSGEVAPGWGYDVALTSGLNNAVGNVRSGRQKVSQAVANDYALTGRVKFTGMAGHEVALSLQEQSDIAQGAAGSDEHSATLLELHGVHNFGPFGLRWLYAMWDIDGAAVKALGRDEQEGFYIEPSYRINDQWGVFARFNQWDNAAGDSTDSEEEQTNVGVNFWPHENVVFKADYEDYSKGTTTEKYAINLGVGYSFH
ncbi:MAG: phosphate-selective porin O and P [Gammaproteobacteria bacterium]|nr:MAG: phosphate-selective porin O and P [Gammaproteobacteria bacterium]TND06791.1 MAG: phosphate-selective porin O and P [Gammaproteobacteria bacterium]